MKALHNMISPSIYALEDYLSVCAELPTAFNPGIDRAFHNIAEFTL